MSKHLRVLEGAGLARGVRQGREQVWQLQPAPLEEARRSLERIAQALGRGARAAAGLRGGGVIRPHEG